MEACAYGGVSDHTNWNSVTGKWRLNLMILFNIQIKQEYERSTIPVPPIAGTQRLLAYAELVLFAG
jgi:hypothetical protein